MGCGHRLPRGPGRRRVGRVALGSLPAASASRIAQNRGGAASGGGVRRLPRGVPVVPAVPADGTRWRQADPRLRPAGCPRHRGLHAAVGRCRGRLRQSPDSCRRDAGGHGSQGSGAVHPGGCSRQSSSPARSRALRDRRRGTRRRVRLRRGGAGGHRHPFREASCVHRGAPAAWAEAGRVTNRSGGSTSRRQPRGG